MLYYSIKLSKCQQFFEKKLNKINEYFVNFNYIFNKQLKNQHNIHINNIKSKFFAKFD